MQEMGEKNFKVSAGDAAAALSQLYWHQTLSDFKFLRFIVQMLVLFRSVSKSRCKETNLSLYAKICLRMSMKNIKNLIRRTLYAK